MKAALLVLIVALASLHAACGYRVVRYRDALGDVQSVAIVGLRNETRDPGLDSMVTDALLREFLRRGALRLVEDPASADLVLRGAVSDARTRSFAFSSIQFALEYEVSLDLDLEVSRRDGSPVPLDARALTESELYIASSDIEVTRKNRLEALRRISTLLAERVHDALFERLAQ